MSRNSHVSLGGASGQPVNRSSGSSFFNNTPSPIPMQISSSRRLSFDSSNRRSNGLAAEAGGDTNASASVTAGNGTANSSKLLEPPVPHRTEGEEKNALNRNTPL